MPRTARIFTREKPCPHGHFVFFSWGNQKCVECTRLRSLAYGAAHRAQAKIRRRQNWVADPEGARAYARERQAARRKLNNERIKECKRIWNAKHPEANRRRAHAWTKAWKESDPQEFLDYSRPYTAKRRASQKNCTPKWLTDAQWKDIKAIYAEAARLTKETGIEHEVDHIIPLAGKDVAGLHVPWNLRAIPATENSRKSNRLLN